MYCYYYFIMYIQILDKLRVVLNITIMTWLMMYAMFALSTDPRIDESLLTCWWWKKTGKYSCNDEFRKQVPQSRLARGKICVSSANNDFSRFCYSTKRLSVRVIIITSTLAPYLYNYIFQNNEYMASEVNKLLDLFLFIYEWKIYIYTGEYQCFYAPGIPFY